MSGRRPTPVWPPRDGGEQLDAAAAAPAAAAAGAAALPQPELAVAVLVLAVAVEVPPAAAHHGLPLPAELPLLVHDDMLPPGGVAAAAPVAAHEPAPFVPDDDLGWTVLERAGGVAPVYQPGAHIPGAPAQAIGAAPVPLPPLPPLPPPPPSVVQAAPVASRSPTTQGTGSGPRPGRRGKRKAGSDRGASARYDRERRRRLTELTRRLAFLTGLEGASTAAVLRAAADRLQEAAAAVPPETAQRLSVQQLVGAELAQAIAVSDMRGAVIAGNGAFTRLLGYSPADMDAGGVPMERITPRDSWAAFRIVIGIALEGRLVAGRDVCPWVHRDGHEVWVSVRGNVVFNAERPETSFFVSFVTEADAKEDMQPAGTVVLRSGGGGGGDEVEEDMRALAKETARDGGGTNGTGDGTRGGGGGGGGGSQS